MRPIVRSLGAAGRVPIHSGAAGHSGSSEQAGNELRLEPGWPAPPCAQLCGPEPWLPQFKALCQPRPRRGLVPGSLGPRRRNRTGGVRVGPGRRGAPRGEGAAAGCEPWSVQCVWGAQEGEAGAGGRCRGGAPAGRRAELAALQQEGLGTTQPRPPTPPGHRSHVTQGERERHRGSQRD